MTRVKQLSYHPDYLTKTLRIQAQAARIAGISKEMSAINGRLVLDDQPAFSTDGEIQPPSAECTCDRDPLGVCPRCGGADMKPETWNDLLYDVLGEAWGMRRGDVRRKLEDLQYGSEPDPEQIAWEREFEAGFDEGHSISEEK
jgi:hypothetical protein